MKKVQDEEIRIIKNVPINEYIRIINKSGKAEKTVYIKGRYDRSLKKYELTAFDDISKTRYIKADKNVLVGFIF